MPATSQCKFSSPVSAGELDIRVDDPIQHLLHCHRKMGRSLAIVQNGVKSLQLTEPVLRAEATAALDYELALLKLLDELHTRDEEDSLFPSLRANLPEASGSLGELTRTLESHRAAKEAIFGELAICVRDIARKRGDLAAEQLLQLEGLVKNLADIFRPHISGDNDPLLESCRRQLTPELLERMRDAMKARFNA